jgi:predicted dienelactone hydrolase
MLAGIGLASNRNVMKRIVATLFVALIAASCCRSVSSLVDPRLRIAPESNAPAYEPPLAVTIVESTETWRDAKRQRDVPVRIYKPAASTGRLPIVIFSHGIGEDRDSYAYLGREWARRGFMAVHITHAGTDKTVLKHGYLELYRATKVRENWINRPLDVTFVLDQLAARSDADLDRVAVAGHSAGAFTAMAVAGLKTSGGESFLDRRVKAVIAISMPKMGEVIPPDGYDDLRVPVLHMTGTCDTSLIYRTFPRDRRVPFESSRSTTPQYLVTLQGVNHDTFSNADDNAHPLIAQIATAFLEGFVNGDEVARLWFDRGGLAAAGKLAVERKTVR